MNNNKIYTYNIVLCMYHLHLCIDVILIYKLNSRKEDF